MSICYQRRRPCAPGWSREYRELYLLITIHYEHDLHSKLSNTLIPCIFRLGLVSGKRMTDAEILQESGVTIDMTGLAWVTVNEDQTVASVGAGASWLDVYLCLDGLGVAVAGGRNAAVGVGGLTLGGPTLSSFSTLYLILTHLFNQGAFPTLHHEKDGHATTS